MDYARFWPAFKSAGLLERVTLVGEPPLEFDGGLNRPDRGIFDERAQAGENILEYQTADVPGMRVGAQLVIERGPNAGTYKVTRKPMQDRAGYFSTVPLERLR
ncbi:hypothetical protein [Paraburkholderia sp. J11-2]|uniref:head-tail joining protein n=1 Tax=Paraburkholderia sp. J11-2 TaxID=2805431 RepID=UPI002AB63BD1|nr:hypothetical protein [Paraburkholderia sp. J11-2]